MGSTNKLSDYYGLVKTEVKDDDSYYSKLELAVKGLSSDSTAIPGFQARIYSGFQNSMIAGDLEGYPVETIIRISPLSEDYTAQVFLSVNNSRIAYNLNGMDKLLSLFDKTNSKEFKIFAGFDGRRWDFIANMDSKKAVLYIKNSVNPMIISRYLMPFVSETLKRRYIAGIIEKKYKAGRR